VQSDVVAISIPVKKKLIAASQNRPAAPEASAMRLGGLSPVPAPGPSIRLRRSNLICIFKLNSLRTQQLHWQQLHSADLLEWS
jgi:hypothetical protein